MNKTTIRKYAIQRKRDNKFYCFNPFRNKNQYFYTKCIEKATLFQRKTLTDIRKKNKQFDEGYVIVEVEITYKVVEKI